jgi:hypothetical protein
MPPAFFSDGAQDTAEFIGRISMTATPGTEVGHFPTTSLS